MTSDSHLRVANLPPKPLMLFDGDCHFCTLWVERWKETTGSAVEYEPFQKRTAEFPEIPLEKFSRAVQMIEPSGEVFSGAEAVFRTLAHAPRRAWPLQIYKTVPGVSLVANAAYRVVARNRTAASAVTRLFWGDDVRKPTYFAARRGFLKTLGLVYLFAFISLWVQVDGLMGEHGILPAGEMMSSLRDSYGAQPLRFPTVCWVSSSDVTLHALCLVGTIAAALLTFGLLPLPALLVCFGCYLSLVVPGQLFFSYQWDSLLLETGFVALFLAPLQWRLRRGFDPHLSAVGLFMAKALLFKLMFMSGMVKLTSGDPSWLNLTALDYHYWTQPLPTIFAWFADKNPEWLKKVSVAATLFVELIVPFFIWTPRRLRLIAAALLIALQLAIAFTGNYCFFNLLAIALCLLLIDDASWAPKRREAVAIPRARWAGFARGLALVIMLPLNAWLCYTAIKPGANWPAPLGVIYSRVEPFMIANSYGLFRVMTTDRPEIVFEGSSDAMEWQPYEFKWKPGDLQRAPQWNAPHQPRLDWSMWFAALGSQRDRVVAERFVACLLRNERSVTRLLARNPFSDKPPQFVRASLYDYRFTTAAERAQSHEWWRRTLHDEYLPTLSLRDFQR